MKKKFFICIILYVFLSCNLCCYGATREEFEKSVRDCAIDFSLIYDLKELTGITNYYHVDNTNPNKAVFEASPAGLVNYIYGVSLNQPYGSSCRAISYLQGYHPVSDDGQTLEEKISGLYPEFFRSNGNVNESVFELVATCNEHGNGIQTYKGVEEENPYAQNIRRFYDTQLKPGDMIECYHNVMIYVGSISFGGAEIKHVVLNVQMQPRGNGSRLQNKLKGMFSLNRDISYEASNAFLGSHCYSTHKTIGYLIEGNEYIRQQEEARRNAGIIVPSTYKIESQREEQSYVYIPIEQNPNIAGPTPYGPEDEKVICDCFAALGSEMCPIKVWRIKQSALDKLDGSLFYKTTRGSDEFDDAEINIEDMLSLFNVDEMNEDDMSKFYYNGIPNGQYSVTKSIWQIIIDNLGQIFDFIIGLSTMVVRMIFVGWTALIEMAVNAALKAISGGGSMESVHITSTEVKSGDGVSIEKIIFNDMSIFDVNFFNFNDENEELR